jgi:acetylornithine deacetylase
MKGPLAAMLHSLLRLRESASDWRGTLSVACVVDEEYRARGVKALLQQSSAYDFAVVGEPSRLRLVRGCKGCLRFEFEAVGKSAHSSTPAIGRSAIVAMSEAILGLDRYFQTELAAFTRPGFGPSTGSVGLVQGGTGINIVPESCRASVDIRLLPGQSAEAVFAALKRHIVSTSVRVPEIEWRFDEPFIDPAFESDPAASVVIEGMKIAGQAEADVVGYSCDASKVAAAGIPCIIYGPGDIALAHTARESIPVDQIVAAVDCYAALARALMPRSAG